VPPYIVNVPRPGGITPNHGDHGVKHCLVQNTSDLRSLAKGSFERGSGVTVDLPGSIGVET